MSTGRKSMGGDDAWLDRPAGPRRNRPRPVPVGPVSLPGASPVFRLLRPPQTADPRAWVADCDYAMVRSVDELRAYLRPAMADKRPVGADSETAHFNVFAPNPVAGFSFSTGHGSARYVPLGHQVGYEHNLPMGDVLQLLQDLDKTNATIWHNWLYDGTVQQVTYGLTLGNWQDTLIAMWLQDCEALSHGLKQSVQRLLGVAMPTLQSVLATAEGDDDEDHSFVDLDPSDPRVVTYTCADADMVRRLWTDRRTMDRVRQQQAVYDLERATFVPFQRMMRNGCYLHDAKLAAVEHAIGNFVKVKGKITTPLRDGGLMAEFDRKVRETLQIPPEVNLNSADQMVPYLLAAGIPLTEKTDSGTKFSLSSKVIKALEADHPVIHAYIAWKKLEALDRNYVRKLRAAHARFGSHVRFPFKQIGAPTGRMACGGDGKNADRMATQGYVNVNVQSLPDSEKEAYLPDIRCAIAADDPLNPDPDPWTLVAIDYSQMQLRIAANVWREPVWIAAYQRGDDLHMVNTRLAYNDPTLPAMVAKPDGTMVDNPKRKAGKTTSFAVLFQAGEETTAKAAKIPLAEAKRLLANFWAGVPRLRDGIDATKRRARTERQTKTWLGRLRSLAHYFAPDAPRGLQGLGEREAVNHPIQGGEAELFKIALVKVDRLLTAMDWHADVKVCLLVHDEMVFRVRTRRLAEVVPQLRATMESVRMPGCPVAFTCDAATGPDWGSLQPWAREPEALPMAPGPIARPARPQPPAMPVPPATPYARRA